MKYICSGYYDKAKFDAMTETERNAMFDACFDYDERMRANGNWGTGESLRVRKPPSTLFPGRTAKWQRPMAPLWKPRSNSAASDSWRLGHGHAGQL